MSQAAFASLPGALAYHAQNRGQDIALRYKHLGIWRVRRWGELADEVAHLANALRQRGFQPHDSLLVQSEGRVEAVLISLAAQWLGGSVTLLEPHVEQAARAAGRFAFVDSVSGRMSLAQAGVRPEVLVYADARGVERVSGAVLVSYAQLLEAPRHPLSQNAAQPAGPAFVLPGATGVFAVSHRELLGNARQLIGHEGLDARDDVLAARAFASSAQVRYVWAPWLAAGLRLNIPETLATRDQDRRELAPSFIVGTAHAYQDLVARVAERAPLPGTFNHWLYQWAMAAPGQQSLLRQWAGYWLVRRPLLDVLGLGRVKAAVLAGSELDPRSRQFLAALGVTPRTWPVSVACFEPGMASAPASLIPTTA